MIYLKKIATLFFLFFAFIIYTNKKPVVSVFEELTYMDEDVQSHYYEITLKKGVLTTKNFEHYFDNIQVISINPMLNPITEKNLQEKLAIYKFTEDTVKNNISYFIKYYDRIVREHGLIKDSNQIYINGIPIQKVKIFSEPKTIGKIKNIIETMSKRDN